MKHIRRLMFGTCFLLCSISSYALPTTFLSIESEPGEWISNGSSHYFDLTNSEFRAFIYDWELGFPKNDVRIASNHQDLSRPYWSFEVGTYGYRVPIELGYYHDSYFGGTYEEFSNKPINAAEISFVAFGHGYSSPRTRFAVLDLTFSPNEDLASLAVAFETKEFGYEDALFGVISYNSDAFDDSNNTAYLKQLGLDVALPSPIPEPSEYVLMSLGLVSLLWRQSGCHRAHSREL